MLFISKDFDIVTITTRKSPGAASDPILLTGRFYMDCPHCNKALTGEEIDGEMISVCHDCGGMWVHRNQLNKMLIEGEGDFESASVDNEPPEEGRPEVPCLDCGDKKMKKVNFLHYSDIIMDYCPACGSFWLDKGELERIHGYVRQVETGSQKVTDRFAYNILANLSKIAYRIFH